MRAQRSRSSLALNPLELIDFTRFYAAEVAAGRYRDIAFDPRERWHQRIYRDQRLDVWILSWLPAQGTQLHDHGGSNGAFTVLSGELTETVAGARGLADHVRGTGASVGFGARYVHDVRNAGAAPAVSVHAYSRPLTSMTFYDYDDSAEFVGGRLVPLATVPTDDPEPDFSQEQVAS